jgi:KipI family sensor histidine kinase inhibitor
VRVRNQFDDAPEETLNEVLGTFHQLLSAAIPGVIELAPAYTSVAVFFDPIAVAKTGVTAEDEFEWFATRIRAAVARVPKPGWTRRSPSRTVEIPVCYDPEFAPDLDDVARHAQISTKEVVDLHCAAEYRVSCIGFVPGFPFLTGLAKKLATPRRGVPRKEIPAGSVGIGGAQTGIYPLRSPGGWNLIGRTPLRLFDPAKDPPALLCAGDRVRFRAITRDEFEALTQKTDAHPARGRSAVEGSRSVSLRIARRASSTSVGMTATIQRAGFLSSVQDLGRTGFREFGVSTSGALDPFALRVANLLVGNYEGAAGLEITLGGLQLRFNDERIVAWCGGEFDVEIGSQQLPAGHVARLQAGDELKFRRPQIGCRAWMAVSGGVDVPVVLGSRSTDLRANFGGFEGRTLRDGDAIPLGKWPGSPTPATIISSWTAPHDWVSPPRHDPILRFVRGMDWVRFNASTLQRFTSESFAVSPDSDRMGARLTGPELRPTNHAELISEAVAPGTIQVPPSGQPILLLGDCQTIGGYPKIAQVITVDLSVAAQLRAGDHVRFSEVSLTNAHLLLLQREHELERFRIGLSLHDP